MTLGLPFVQILVVCVSDLGQRSYPAFKPRQTSHGLRRQDRYMERCWLMEMGPSNSHIATGELLIRLQKNVNCQCHQRVFKLTPFLSFK